MHGLVRQPFAAALMIGAGLILACTQLPAQDHVVTSADLNQAVASAAQSREQHVQQVKRFLSSHAARQALKRAHIDPVQVQQAVGSLDDEELARLSARAEKAQRDFAAGALTNEQLTYIIIALATAVIIIVILAAR
ncbi:MAG TPA: hypothetical protein VGW33_05435 [Terriglobia bacterium]|nr:hypothetical protein [Terriglobia bacterium]